MQPLAAVNSQARSATLFDLFSSFSLLVAFGVVTVFANCLKAFLLDKQSCQQLVPVVSKEVVALFPAVVGRHHRLNVVNFEVFLSNQLQAGATAVQLAFVTGFRVNPMLYEGGLDDVVFNGPASSSEGRHDERTKSAAGPLASGMGALYVAHPTLWSFAGCFWFSRHGSGVSEFVVVQIPAWSSAVPCSGSIRLYGVGLPTVRGLGFGVIPLPDHLTAVTHDVGPVAGWSRRTLVLVHDPLQPVGFLDVADLTLVVFVSPEWS